MIGTQLGTKAKAVLECLRKNGKLNRLDLERLINLGPLAITISGMYGIFYIKQYAGQRGIYEITKLGRQALGEALTTTEPAQMRVCNGSMTERYVPDIHLHQRLGVARL